MALLQVERELRDSDFSSSGEEEDYHQDAQQDPRVAEYYRERGVSSSGSSKNKSSKPQYKPRIHIPGSEATDLPQDKPYSHPLQEYNTNTMAGKLGKGKGKGGKSKKAPARNTKRSAAANLAIQTRKLHSEAAQKTRRTAKKRKQEEQEEELYEEDSVGDVASENEGDPPNGQATDQEDDDLVSGSDREAAVGGEEDADAKLKRLERENERLRNHVSTTGKGRKKQKKAKDLNCFEREIIRNVKEGLWRVCKHFAGEGKVTKGCEFVLKILDLKQFDGLKGQELQDAKNVWIASHRDLIRYHLNKHRNYVVGEIRTWFLDMVAKNKLDQLPTKEEMIKILLREVFDKEGDKKEEGERMVRILVPFGCRDGWFGFGSSLPSSVSHPLCSRKRLWLSIGIRSCPRSVAKFGGVRPSATTD